MSRVDGGGAHSLTRCVKRLPQFLCGERVRDLHSHVRRDQEPHLTVVPFKGGKRGAIGGVVAHGEHATLFFGRYPAEKKAVEGELGATHGAGLQCT